MENFNVVWDPRYNAPTFDIPTLSEITIFTMQCIQFRKHENAYDYGKIGKMYVQKVINKYIIDKDEKVNTNIRR